MLRRPATTLLAAALLWATQGHAQETPPAPERAAAPADGQSNQPTAATVPPASPGEGPAAQGEAASGASAPVVHGEAAAEPVHLPAAAAAPASAPASQPDSAEPLAPSVERETLQALVDGSLAADVDFRSFFTIPLTDPAAVARRRQLLEGLLRDNAGALKDLDAQIKALRTKAPEAPQPPAPPALEEPTPPEVPAFVAKKKKRLSAKERKLKEAYQLELARFQEQRAAYDQAQREHAAALEAFAEAQAAHADASSEHRAALQQAERAQAARLEELTARRAETAQRLEVLRLRHTYLARVERQLQGMGGAAQRALASLSEPREALRRYAARVEALAQATSALDERLRALAARGEAGALVGFLVDRERLLEQIGAAQRQVETAATELGQLAVDLAAMARAQEEAGAMAQRAALRAAGADAGGLVDDTFLEHFREARRLRKVVAGRAADRSAADVERLTAAVAATLARPAAVGTVADAEAAVAAAQERQVEVMALVDARRVDLARWQIAFERQIVAALDPLMSPQARDEAYAFSAAYFFDLQDEVQELFGRITSWALQRGKAIWAVVTFHDAAVTWSWLGRLVLAVVLVLAYAPLRRRVPGAVTWLVRQAARSGPLQGRIGSLVRWAGLLQTVAPPLLVLLLGYLVLAALGRGHVELQMAEVVFRWLMLYVLGREALVGLTRRVSRGRPALIKVSDEAVALLRLTYGRLGLVLVLTAAAYEFTGQWLAAGRLTALIDFALLVGLLGWFLWACLGWRPPLAQRLAELAPEGSWLARLAARMGADWRLAPLSPLVFVGVVGHYLYGVGRDLFVRGGLSTWFRARELKRRARKGEAEEGAPAELSPSYLDDFPLYPLIGEQSAAVLPREELVGSLLEQIKRWRETRAEGSATIVGEKGIGKSTLVGMLIPRLGDLQVSYHTLQGKRTSEAALVAELAPVFGVDDAQDCATLAAELDEGPERVMLLDDAHNTFMRTVDGFRGFDALVRLVNATSERVFWVVVFNRFAWEFINASRRREHYFRKLIELPRWSAAELQELIGLRNRRSGFTVKFDELLLDEEAGGAGQFQLVEGADGFFRLLWQTSRGNPRVATYLWLSALHAVDETTLRVGLFRTPSSAALDKLGDELLFALAAVCQHENLTDAELCETLNISPDFARFALRILREHGFVEAKPDNAQRMTLTPRFYAQVLDTLRAKHLLFEI